MLLTTAVEESESRPDLICNEIDVFCHLIRGASPERNTIIEKIHGKETTAYVYKAVDLRYKRTVALKVFFGIKFLEEKDKRYIEREATYLKNTKHRNILYCFQLIK